MNSFDFNDILLTLQNKLSLLSNWRKTLYYGAYQRILEAIAYIMERIVYVANFLYKETNWKLATLRKSLATMSYYLSYKPYRKKGAFGNIQVIADSTWEATIPYTYYGLNITIPKWCEFTNQNGDVEVYAIEQTTYNTGHSGILDVPVKEGIPKTFTYSAKGNPNETFNIFSDSVDNDEIELYIVDNIGNILNTVSVVDELYFINDLNNYYCEINNPADGQSVSFKFGDGVSQKKLNTGDKVKVFYADTGGASIEISSQNTITKFKTILYDSLGNEVTNLYCRNQEAISDGKNAEDIESIRQNGKNLFASGYRCGTGIDWVSIINSLSYIYKSKVWTAEDLGGSTLMTDQNTVYVSAITTSGDDLTTSQQTYIKNNILAEKKSPTELIIFEPLQKIYLMFIGTFKIANQTISYMKQAVKQVIHDNYSVLKTDFQTNIYESNYISLLNSVTNVLYHNTNLYQMEYNVEPAIMNYEILVSKPASVEPILINQIYFEYESPSLWLKRKISGNWLIPKQIGITTGVAISGVAGQGQAEYPIIDETLNVIGTRIYDNLDNLTIRPNSLSIYDMGNIVTTIEVNNNDETGRFSGSRLDATGNNVLYYDTGLLDIKLNFTPSGTVTANYTQFRDFTITGTVDYVTNKVSYTVLELLLDVGSGIVYGVRNPGDNDPNGYILTLAYRTQDGNGDQINNVRLPDLNQITDVDSDFIFLTMNY